MDELQRLLDRQSVIDAIHTWCTAIDSRDWPKMHDLITDPVHIDYSSNGTPAIDLPATGWTARLSALYGFDATLHMVSNIVPVIDGDAAVCKSYVNAMHFLTEDGQELNAYACGVYTHLLRRIDGRWRIYSATFTVAGRHSGSAEFVAAFTRAREIAPSRAPA